MSREVRYHPQAAAELVEAEAWYEQRRRGLGDRFMTESELALRRTAAGRTPARLWPSTLTARSSTEDADRWVPLGHRQVRAPDAPVRLGFAAEESAVLEAWANRSGGRVLDVVVHA